MVLMIELTVDTSESFPYSVRWVNASNQIERIAFNDCCAALQFVGAMFPHQVDVAYAVSNLVGPPDLCPDIPKPKYDE